MSIASEIARLQSAKSEIASAITEKGVAVPSSAKLDGYPALIGQIPTGITPSGTKEITANGTYDVASFASASVSVSPRLQTKIAHPSTTGTLVVPDEGYDGLRAVNIFKVTSAIDANIVAGNIKKDVTILGVTGTFEGGSGGYPAAAIEATLTNAGTLNNDSTIPWASLQSAGLQFTNWQDVYVIVRAYMDGDLTKPMGGWFYGRGMSPVGTQNQFFGYLYLNGSTTAPISFLQPSRDNYVPRFYADANGLTFMNSRYQWKWGSTTYKKVRIIAMEIPGLPTA